MTSVRNICLGEGAYGRVMRLALPHGHIVVKSIATDNYPSREQIIGEMLAQDVRHGALTAVVDVFCVGREAKIVMSYAGDLNLLDAALTCIGSAAVAIADASRAVSYLHALHFVHQDVKPENVLWDDLGQRARLTDYGCLRLQGSWTFCRGTPPLQPPEVAHCILLDKKHLVCFSIDAWMFGLFIFAVLSNVVYADIGGGKCVTTSISANALPLLAPNPIYRGCIQECASDSRDLAYHYRDCLPRRDSTRTSLPCLGFWRENARHFAALAT